MSSIYKHLSKNDLKAERTNPVFLPTAEKITAKPASTAGVKIAIVLAFLFSLAAFAVTGYLFENLRQEKAGRQDTEAAYADFQKRAETLQAEGQEYRAEIRRMTDQLKSYSQERQDLKKQLSQSQIEISNLQKKIQNLEDRNRAIEQKTQALQEEVRAQPVSLRAPAGESTEVSAVQETAAEFTPIPGENSESAADVPSPKRVMTVNRKFNFVVVNLGLRDNLRMGDKLIVERDGKTVAGVEVEKLYDNFAAATIVDTRKNGEIKEGDLVRKA